MLGRAVTSAALAAGHRVVAIDLPRPPVGAPGAWFADDEAVTRVAVDITDYAALEPAVRGCEALVHLAALTSPRAVPEPGVHHNNVIASYNSLLAAASNGIDKVCLASSVNAIGGAWSSDRPRYERFPLTEEHPSATEDPYSLSKWIAEAQAADFARRNPAARVVSLRLHALLRDRDHLRSWLTNPPGPRQRDLWGYTVLDDAGAACLASLDADFTGSEVIYVVAPTTNSTALSWDLRNDFYPDVPVVGDLSGHRGFFDCTKAARLIGIEPHAL